MTESKVRIGIDLDNTIVDYHAIFCERANKLGYLKNVYNLKKNDVKNYI